MPAVFSTQPPATLPSIRRPETTTSPERRATAAGLAQLLCGGGLIVCGLLRGSWPGLTLAAVGGFLVYRGLTASRVRPTDGRPSSTQVDVPVASEPARPPAVVLPPVESEAWLGQDLKEAVESAPPPPLGTGPGPGDGLTLGEHAEAEMAAYHLALQRGGGRLPPYEQAMAVEDFRRAAEGVLRRRVGR